MTVRTPRRARPRLRWSAPTASSKRSDAAGWARSTRPCTRCSRAALPSRSCTRELRRHPGMATRMVQEAAILEDVRHPGIVRVFECNVLPDHRPWIAMELVEGETLASRLHYAHDARRRLEVATLLAEVCRRARRGPRARRRPSRSQARQPDAHADRSRLPAARDRLGRRAPRPVGRLTLDGLTPGTPIYMSPEQATGKNIAAPCDIYSLGVIAYEALARPSAVRRPHARRGRVHAPDERAGLAARTLRARREPLCDLVHRMLEKDPSVRPCAIEVRQIARAIALELSTTAYEELGISTDRAPADPEGRTPRPRAHDHSDRRGRGCRPRRARVRRHRAVARRPRKPRWTPEIGLIPGAIAAQPAAFEAIDPRTGRADWREESTNYASQAAREAIADEVLPLLRKKRPS